MMIMRTLLNLSQQQFTLGMATRCEVPPPEPGDSAVTRRRVVAKRTPTDDDEEEMRQKRLRSEPGPELFPLTGEELSETSRNPDRFVRVT